MLCSCIEVIISASSREKLSAGFPTRSNTNQPAQLKRQTKVHCYSLLFRILKLKAWFVLGGNPTEAL